MCEPFHDIWAITAALIASEAPRIRAHTLGCKSNYPMIASI